MVMARHVREWWNFWVICISMSLQSKSLIKNTFIYSIGSFGSKALSFLLLPLYSFFLTKKELGEYDIFITMISLFIPLVSLQISDSAYRWLVSDEKKSEDNITKVITNSLVILGVSTIIFALIFYIYIGFSDFSYSNYFISLLIVSSFLIFFQNILRGLGKTKEFSINGLVVTFFILACNIMFIYLLRMKVEGIILAGIIGNGIGIFYIIWQQRLYNFFNIRLLDKIFIKEMLYYSLPLVPNLMSWWLIGSAGKLVILNYLGEEANGVYAVSSRFAAILAIINSVLVLPIQDDYLKKGSDFESFRRVVQSFIYIQLIFVLVLSFGAPIYTKFLVEKSFYEAWMYMPLLYFGVALNTVAALMGLVYQKEQKTLRITLTTLFGGFISIIVSILLIRDYGLLGVSFGLFMGYVIMLLSRLWDIRKRYDFKFNYIKILFISIIITIAINTIKYISYNIQMITFIIVLILAMILTYKRLRSIIKR
ncbi:hypothetical protein CYV15_08160 [Riemerella anatipestifer]|nr:hypothetical protein CYV15_08160 [Riemerella anatipestifer]